ncbi:MAG: 1,4-dihydroxy-2-naphthoate polyprenyltransferase [Deltaproteobacteria bacterium]|nr:1,4-dihydroxy-2-naphthoate polyprenyltransferase [Deltaproteobacteria bacterium]
MTAAATEQQTRPSALVAWLHASRPRTLAAGLAPVAVGSGVAWHDGAFAPLSALAALVGALLIQIGTNLANDYFDYRRGADTGERLGPPRATQQGWLAPKAVLAGALSCFALSAVVGIYLVAVAGLPILAVGLVSIAAGYAYTGGPYPLAYHGLGDAFVLVFFGLVAVGGTYFVQAQGLTPLALAAGVPVGALGVALLAVNNTRDARTDAAAGKRTLVVRFGVAFGRFEYVAMLCLAALAPIALWAWGWASPWVLLSLLAAPLAAPPLRLVFAQEGRPLNGALAGTARLQLVYSLLLAVGLSR